MVLFFIHDSCDVQNLKQSLIIQLCRSCEHDHLKKIFIIYSMITDNRYSLQGQSIVAPVTRTKTGDC